MNDHMVTSDNFHSRQADFRRANPNLWVMIRPDRPFDLAKNRYADAEARRKGNAAMMAWFEYLDAKGFRSTLSSWLSMLSSGLSVMVVCPEPSAFDLLFVPSSEPFNNSKLTEFEKSRKPITAQDSAMRERCLKIIYGCLGVMRMKQAEMPFVGARKAVE